MGVKMHELSFADATWQLNNLDADRGVDVLARLAAIVGGPMGELLGALAAAGKPVQKISAAELPRDALAKVFGTLLSQMHSGGAKDIIRELLAGLKKDKKDLPGGYALYFAGNYGELFRLVAWALEINYASFFGGNTTLLAGLQSGVLASLLRPPVSDGSSGG